MKSIACLIINDVIIIICVFQMNIKQIVVSRQNLIISLNLTRKAPA